MTALLSTPNSFASSYTRTFATTLPLLGPEIPGLPAGRGSACSVRRQLVLFIAACSSGAHCSLSLLSSGASGCRHRHHAHPAVRYSPDRNSVTCPAGKAAGRRSARGNALRRWACSKHARLRCRYAPRPGSRMATSGTISPPAATTRTKSALSARSPHPMHVRIGAACLASSLQGLRPGATGRCAGPAARLGRRAVSTIGPGLARNRRGLIRRGRGLIRRSRGRI